MKTTSFVRETPSRKIIIFVKSSTSVKKTPSIETSRIIIINEYRPSYIDVKNVIAFVSLKIKKTYNARHQFIFFKVRDLVNLRLHKNYKVFIIISKKIKS